MPRPSFSLITLVLMKHRGRYYVVSFISGSLLMFRVMCYFRLRMLRDGGVIQRLRLNNWPYLGQDQVKSTTVGVDLRAVAPLLVLLSSSVVVSIVVLMLERGKFTFCSSGTQNTTRRERNISRQRSVLKASALSKCTCPVFDIRKTQSTAYGFQ